MEAARNQTLTSTPYAKGIITEIFGLVVTRGDTPPVVEFVEQALDEVALAVIFAVLGDGLWIGVQKGPR